MSSTPKPLHSCLDATVSAAPVSMQLVTAMLPSRLLAMLESLRRLASERGQPAYLVGGPLRDAALGAPLRDLDFSIEGDAPALAASLASELGGRLTVHPRFGTATVKLEEAQIDLVTARKEVYPRPGSLPQITPGSIDDDLARRDFSINAMALPIWGSGGLLDPHDGLDDVAYGRVRTLHDGSFFDDPTRMLRAVRYEQRFGFNLEETTERNLRDALSAGAVATVSGDRWRHELDRILAEDRPAKTLFRAAELGLLAGIHPALTALAVSDALARIQESPGPGAGACLAALVYPMRPAAAEGVIRRFNLTNRQAKLVRDTIWLREQESALARVVATPSKLAGFLGGIDVDAVAAVAVLSNNIEVSRGLTGHLASSLTAPRLTGTDLIAMGMSEGPGIGEVLALIRDARLDGLAATDEEERRLARTLIAKHK